MIKVDKENLEENIGKIKDLSVEYQGILDKISKLRDELEISSKSEKIFPNIIDQIEVMKDDLEKLGVESINNLGETLEEVVSSFEEVDEGVGKEMKNGA